MSIQIIGMIFVHRMNDTGMFPLDVWLSHAGSLKFKIL